MNKIEHYILPEHSNDLYKHEAISSIALTKGVAEKINEIIDTCNTLSHTDLKWKQEQEGKIRKGVLYMKDNLINSLHDLLSLMVDSGDFVSLVDNHVITSIANLKDRTISFVNAKEYGVVCNGINDDSTALQNAINENVVVVLPSGTIKTTKTIEIPSGHFLIGTGVNTVIKSSASIAIQTMGNNCVLKNFSIQGDYDNIALSLSQTKQIIDNINIENFAVGAINKNSDYIGTVKFINVNMNKVNTCFKFNTLTNGVSFTGCVFYRFDTVIEAYWIEAVSFNNCHIELGNESSVIVRTLEGKSNCRCMPLTFNNCYIERFYLLFSNTVNGSVSFNGCWLYTTNVFHNNNDSTIKLNVDFNNCAFSISSTTDTTNPLFILGESHSFNFNHIYCMKNGVGEFTFNQDIHTIGGNVVVDGKVVKFYTQAFITDDNGLVKLPLNSLNVLMGVNGYADDSNILALPYSSGDYWYVKVVNQLSLNPLANKTVQLRYSYVSKQNYHKL